MGNKVTEAINNFRRADTRTVEPEQPSVADALGLKPPPLSAQQKAGLSAEAALAKQRFEASVAAHEKYKKERADYEAARDDQIWKRVLARRVAL
jgi:hypothetical protein